jgi:hypothetical protein
MWYEVASSLCLSYPSTSTQVEQVTGGTVGNFNEGHHHDTSHALGMCYWLTVCLHG